MISSSQDINHL